jgi:UDP-3-O-[3-hydroxymyristoyl] glucosamine N-acyltransferase
MLFVTKQTDNKFAQSIKSLAQIIDGAIDGVSDLVISTITPSSEPNSTAITYMVGKYVIPKDTSKFAAVITNKSGADKIRTTDKSTPLIIVDDPQRASLKLVDVFFPKINPKEFFPNHKTAIISQDVQIGDDCIIHPNVVIYPGVKIGARAVIYAGVVIREGTVIGDDCIIHANTVIGADGFGYIQDPIEGLKAVPQVGNVIIGNKVHIGANTTIDRGAMGATRIGDGTKIDNLVQIGHNVQIGKFCVLCAQVGISGSCILGDGVILAGKVGVADHLKIASGVRVGGASNVLTNILEPGDYAGTPAIKSIVNHRNSIELARLQKTISGLKKYLAQ